MQYTIPLKDLSQALGCGYWSAWRWLTTGLIRGRRIAGGKAHDFHGLDREAAIEFAVLVRLRRTGVPLQRLRRAAAAMRAGGLQGARWLALREYGADVLVRDKGALTSVLDHQGYIVQLVDVEAVRADVVKIEAKVREARRATA